MPAKYLKTAVNNVTKAINDTKKNGMTTEEVKKLAESRKPETEINDSNIREVVFTPKESTTNRSTITAGGGTSTDYGTYRDDLNRLTKAQRQAQVDQLKAARTKALANLDAQEQTIKPYYQNARNLTSASSQQGARNFAEYLANRGLANSGAAAQSEINRLSTLQNNLGNLNTAEANAYRDIANQRTAVENDYVAGLANANNAITNNYYNNLLNYNEQQRQKIQALQQQALGQYANDYQAYKNQLLAQGYDPNSYEVLSVDALRGQKMNNAYGNAYTYSNSMNNILNGNWSYNDLLATGMTNEQATKLYNDTVAAKQAQADATAEQLAYDRAQQQWENDLDYQNYLLKKRQVEYDTNKPYYKPTTPRTDNPTVKQLSLKDVQGILANTPSSDRAKTIDYLYNTNQISDELFDYYQ